MKPPSKKLKLLCKFSAQKRNQTLYADAIKRVEGMIAEQLRRRVRIEYDMLIGWLSNTVVANMVLEYQRMSHDYVWNLSITDYRIAANNIAPLFIAKFPDTVLPKHKPVSRMSLVGRDIRARNAR
jgi:hypothetical protein